MLSFKMKDNINNSFHTGKLQIYFSLLSVIIPGAGVFVVEVLSVDVHCFDTVTVLSAFLIFFL